MAIDHRTGIESAGITNIVLAGAVFFAPFFTGDTGSVLASNLVTGALVVALAGHNIYAASNRHTERALAPALINVLLGVWLLASGWVFGATTALTVTNAVLGGLLAVLAGYNSWAANDARQRHTLTRT